MDTRINTLIKKKKLQIGTVGFEQTSIKVTLFLKKEEIIAHLKKNNQLWILAFIKTIFGD